MNVAGVLRGRLRIARARLWTRAGKRVVPTRELLALPLSLVTAALTFAVAHAMFGLLESLGLTLSHAGAALALVFAVVVAGMLVLDVHHAVSTLLLDSDLELLRRAPLSPRALLLLKLVDSLPQVSTPLLLVTLPTALAFALVHTLPLWAWLLVPLALAAQGAVPLGLGAAAGLALVRWAPARRARDLLVLLSTLGLVAFWLAFSFLLPRQMDESVGLGEWLAGALTAPAWLVAISPPHWAARSLEAAASGRVGESLAWALAVTAGAAASLGIAILAARAWLADTLARVSVDPRPARVRSSPTRRHARGIQVWILKDLRVFSRDWTVLADVLTSALLWTLLPLLTLPLQATPAPALARSMMIAMTVGLGFSVGARLVPLERDGLAWSRLAPVPALRWNLAKLGGGMALSLPLMLVAAAMVKIALPVPWSHWGEALLAGLSALALALCLGLWTGWQFRDPAATLPHAMLTWSGRMVAAGLLLTQAGMWLWLASLADRHAGALPAGVTLWGPPLLGGVLGALFVAAATARAKRYEWLS